jgi:predicted Zn-dependent peptidase
MGQSRGSPDEWALYALSRAIPGHPLANGVLSRAESLRALDPEVLQVWWRAHVVGPRTAIVAVGDCADEALRQACIDLGTRIPESPPQDAGPTFRVAPAPVAPTGPIPGPRGWVLRGPPLGQPDELAFRLAERVVARAMSVDSGPADWASALHFLRSATFWTLCGPGEGAEGEAVRHRNLLLSLAHHGPSPVELSRAKEGLMNLTCVEEDDPVWTLTRLGEEWSVMGRVREAAELRAGVAAVTAEDVRRAMREALEGAGEVGRDAGPGK